MKQLVMLGLFAGSTIGTFVPMLWGDSAFSFASILWGAIGGIAGIYLGYRLSQY